MGNDSLRAAVEQAVLRGPGQSTPEQRQAAARGGEGLSEELAALVQKVRLHAYRITDAEVAALRAKHSDDVLFELIVAAALGAAQLRLEAGLRALEGA
jgi:hypothetical protein